ncbi:class I SAM-dependent methyltransferase [Rhodoferax sp. AJA081-3]|nr:class I SAM-dependent methyltransferase [Rhodoferax sp. AJA081-3]
MMISSLKKFFNADKKGRKTSSPALPKRSIPQLDRIASFFSPVFWGVEKYTEFSKAVKDLTEMMPDGYHASDNFITWGRNNSMFDDQKFVQAWESNAESFVDKGIVWRRYILATSAFHCVQLDGDFVECGTYTGVGVKTVVDYLGGKNFPKQFWAYDVFEHQEGMENIPLPEVGHQLHERVQRKFEGYPQVRIVKGLIPDSFEGNCPDRIAYLHIDLNQAPAEVAALDYLFDRVVPGGIVILDDYEWAMVYRPQKLAEDEWFDKRGYRVVPLPTGQGMVIKR